MEYINVKSEIGQLKRVMLHRPGVELAGLMPDYLERMLAEDTPDVEMAGREHDVFAGILRDAGVDVVYIEKEFAEIKENDVSIINTDLILEDGVIVDISGGGAKFISDKRFEKDTKILFMFDLNMNGKPTEYSVIGRIILSEPLEGRDGEYRNHIQFINIKDKDREGIIRYIFEEERKIRRKASGIEE